MEISLVFQTHPSEEVLEEYAFGRLSEDRAAPIEEHLLVCAACQSVFEDIDQYIHLMKAATRPDAVPPNRGIRHAWDAIRTMTLQHRGAAWAITAMAAFLAAGLSLRTPPSAAPAEITLASFRGGDSAGPATAPARTPLDLTINAANPGVARQYRVEIVNAFGEQAWTGIGNAKDGEVSVQVPQGFRAGMYWVRLYGPQSELLSESGLRLK